MVDYKKIDEMWNTGKFQVGLTIINGKFDDTLDLVCTSEDCNRCLYTKNYNDDNSSVFECEYGYISSRDIESYLLYFKPKEVMRRVRGLPEKDFKYWFDKLQETYPIKDFPEYYV